MACSLSLVPLASLERWREGAQPPFIIPLYANANNVTNVDESEAAARALGQGYAPAIASCSFA